jgi:hypothetical protein
LLKKPKVAEQTPAFKLRRLPLSYKRQTRL